MTHIGHGEKVFIVRIFLTLLLFIFSLQSWVKADNVSEFEIQGISVGDSLLDHFSDKEIQQFYQNASYYRDNIFAVIFVKNNSKNYDRIQVTLKPNDNNHEVHAIEGIIDFDKKITECNKKKKSIINDLKHLFVNYQRIDDDKLYAADSTNNSFSYTTWFFIDNGGFISVSCTKMGKEVRKSRGWTDELSIGVTSKEMETFLSGNPF